MALDPKVRQHDVERGEILRMLVGFKGTWMKARTLLHALDDIGTSLSPEDLGLPPQLPGRRQLHRAAAPARSARLAHGPAARSQRDGRRHRHRAAGQSRPVAL